MVAYGTELLLTLQAATPEAGVALINGTPTMISWTAPNDGAFHRVIVFAEVLVSTSPMEGGEVQLAWTAPYGANTLTETLVNANSAPGSGNAVGGAVATSLVKAGTTVAIKQESALTSGAATLYAEIWGS
jgi:hypothetical protein